jgi:hypothetical protein
MRSLLLALAVAVIPSFGFAQSADSSAQTQRTAPGDDLKPAQKTERGWFFFEDPKKKKDQEEQPITPNPPQTEAKAPPPPKKEDRCKKADTWTQDCGFIDPGTDYEFQAKQRDALLIQMSMSQNDPKAVEQFQYYMRWVMGRASEVANLWAFNMAQNPELDPAAKQPISTFGIRMMTDVRNGAEKEIWKVLQEEGGMLVFFTKSDCQFCHSMVPSMQRISQETGIPVRNAALDDKCLGAFLEGCLAGAAVAAPAQALQVTIVPSVFLYAKPNTWIRIGTGITDESTLKSRMFSFFSAYRTAMLKGVNNAQKGRVSVDFSSMQDISGTSKGVETEKGVQPKLPTEDDVQKMLGAH